MNVIETVRKTLLDNRDEKYGDFTAALLPNLARDSIIGVRVPVVRKLAAQMLKDKTAEAFTALPEHRYYEENNLHSFIIAKTKDYERGVREIDVFLPHIDNWSTCDGLSPECVRYHSEEYYPQIEKYLKSAHTYTVRFGLNMLMKFYLKDNFKSEYAELAASVRSDDYYIKMAQAWYFATALAYRYDDAVKYLETPRLDLWSHNKTISKAMDSYRISEERKIYLRTLRRK